jgi:hypothetical protein
MDTFKIICIIFMMIVIYQIYVLNKAVFKDKFEGFEGTTQNVTSGIDDTNAINTLAQIAKNLMAGGVTVPGNMTLNGSLNSTGNINVRTGEYNTRIGGIWTAPGIYAEGNKNLEIGAGSGNTFIGAANGGANQNLVVTGNQTVGGNVSVGGNTNLAGLAMPLIIKKGANSPDNLKFQWGDGTGWRLRFQKDDSNPTMDVYDNGSVHITRNLIVGGRDILGELNEIKNNYVKFETRNVSFKPNPDPDRCFDFGSHGRTGCDNGWSIGMLTKR